VTCLVTSAGGNFTVFLFTAIEPKTPELEGVQVDVKSLAALVKAEGVP